MQGVLRLYALSRIIERNLREASGQHAPLAPKPDPRGVSGRQALAQRFDTQRDQNVELARRGRLERDASVTFTLAGRGDVKVWCPRTESHGRRATQTSPAPGHDSSGPSGSSSSFASTLITVNPRAS